MTRFSSINENNFFHIFGAKEAAMKTFRLLTGLFVMVSLWGCGSGNGGSIPVAPEAAVNITGIWGGIVASTVSGMSTATLKVTQVGNIATGSYSTTAGFLGTFSGTVTGTTLSFTMTSIQPGCTGTFSGTGNVSTPQVGQPTMSFNYNGSSTCGGLESGTGTLTKQ